MRLGIKGVAIAVLTAAVLTTAACGGSGKAASPATSTSAATTSAAPVGGASGTTLTTDQISKVLLTDKDEAGYTYDPSHDSKTTTDTQDVVTAGAGGCQTFVDAEEALSTKYGTTAEVDRQLTKAADAHTIQSSVLALPSADKALAMISDLTAGLQGCKSLSMTQSGDQLAMTLSVIPQLTTDGQAGYIDYMTVGGKTVLMAAELVRVGKAVSVVAIVGPPTTDAASIRQMGGTTLAHLSDIQVQRLKTAQGLS